MKKILISIGVIVSLIATSCSDDFLAEDPKGSITPATFYKTGSDLKMASAALALQFNGAFNQMAGNYYGADDITSKRAGNKIDFSDFDTFRANSSNGRLTNWWQYFYATIKSANSIIQNYEKASEATDAEKNNTGGHAYFMRAMAYFYLTRSWGKCRCQPNQRLTTTGPTPKYRTSITSLWPIC